MLSLIGRVEAEVGQGVGLEREFVLRLATIGVAAASLGT